MTIFEKALIAKIPRFDPGWSDEVKITWMQTFKDFLAKHERHEEEQRVKAHQYPDRTKRRALALLEDCSPSQTQKAMKKRYGRGRRVPGIDQLRTWAAEAGILRNTRIDDDVRDRGDQLMRTNPDIAEVYKELKEEFGDRAPRHRSVLYYWRKQLADLPAPLTKPMKAITEGFVPVPGMRACLNPEIREIDASACDLRRSQAIRIYDSGTEPTPSLRRCSECEFGSDDAKVAKEAFENKRLEKDSEIIMFAHDRLRRGESPLSICEAIAVKFTIRVPVSKIEFWQRQMKRR
jgi:hypothetical protein